jgi:hypothetical protein
MKFIRSAVLTLASGIALYGAYAIYAPAKALADLAPNCCNFGQDCPGDQHCFYPGSGETPCSPDRPNYCGDATIIQ